ncbi:flippase-like domain-containing protein [Litorivicinus sp.]|nr:flippase-like domain-containing protein [Litorivicinus sp.]
MAPLKENNTQTKNQSIRQKLFLGTAILFLTVGIAASLLDLKSTLTAFSQIPAVTLGVIFLLGSVSWLLRGLRTWIVFQEFSLLEALGISFLHNTANNLAPMRLGELALPALARWLAGIKFSVGLTSLIWIRFLDLISLLSIGFCILLLPSLGSIMLACLAILVFATPMIISHLIPKIQNLPLPKSIENARTQLIFEAKQGKRLHRIWRLTILAWLTKLIAMAILLGSLAGLPITEVMATILGAELSSILPIHGLAGAGSYEAGGALGASLAGQSPLAGLELAIQLHLYVLSLTLLFGILGGLLLLKRTIHG